MISWLPFYASLHLRVLLPSFFFFFFSSQMIHCRRWVVCSIGFLRMWILLNALWGVTYNVLLLTVFLQVDNFFSRCLLTRRRQQERKNRSEPGDIREDESAGLGDLSGNMRARKMLNWVSLTTPTPPLSGRGKAVLCFGDAPSKIFPVFSKTLYNVELLNTPQQSFVTLPEVTVLVKFKVWSPLLILHDLPEVA